jgi:ppGpp synthetase/RelA/SpoT-type nucleotidyltranferase
MNNLDPHCQAILKEYRQAKESCDEAAVKVRTMLEKVFKRSGLIVAAIESRVKTESSLAGKLELKGSKYASLADITDIVGVRVITFYTDDVDKVASAVEKLFKVDWENSVDKRKLHEIDSFGYMSLHYICSMDGFPYRFEIQMRTVLQHAWANMNHDTGYKSGVEIPIEYRRSLSRLSGLLELADEQFSIIRADLADYRRRVQALVASGNLSEVPLDGDSFRSYLNMRPFDALNRRIASMNQAEIQETPLMQYMEVFRALQCKTLGDVDKLIKEYSEGAFQLACYQIGLTDLDIISSSLGPQDICIAYIVHSGAGKPGLKLLLDTLNGAADSNAMMAEILLEQTSNLPFMNQ